MPSIVNGAGGSVGAVSGIVVPTAGVLQEPMKDISKDRGMTVRYFRDTDVLLAPVDLIVSDFMSGKSFRRIVPGGLSGLCDY